MLLLSALSPTGIKCIKCVKQPFSCNNQSRYLLHLGMSKTTILVFFGITWQSKRYPLQPISVQFSTETLIWSLRALGSHDSVAPRACRGSHATSDRSCPHGIAGTPAAWTGDDIVKNWLVNFFMPRSVEGRLFNLCNCECITASYCYRIIRYRSQYVPNVLNITDRCLVFWFAAWCRWKNQEVENSFFAVVWCWERRFPPFALAIGHIFVLIFVYYQMLLPQKTRTFLAPY